MLSQNLSGGTQEDITQISARTPLFLSEIRTMHISNTGPQHYRYISLFDLEALVIDRSFNEWYSDLP
jgi:hypothetical protein